MLLLFPDHLLLTMYKFLPPYFLWILVLHLTLVVVSATDMKVCSSDMDKKGICGKQLSDLLTLMCQKSGGIQSFTKRKLMLKYALLSTETFLSYSQ